MSLHFSSITQQVAAHLRAELIRGRWGGTIPGRNGLAEALGVNRKTVAAALKLLEEEGILVNQGPRRKRRVVLPKGGAGSMRVAFLEYDAGSKQHPYSIEILHRLEDAGHTPFSTEQTLIDLKMKLPGVRRLVEETHADAWVVCAGSREVLEWFADQPVPAFALFGHRDNLPLPSVGPDKRSAMVAATRRLLELGHRRMVLLCMGERRHPEPGLPEQAFLETLETQGIRTGPYNLPGWKESPEGLQAILDSLFQMTPPTALIIENPKLLFAPVQQFLTRHGLRVPEDVSLICTDKNQELAWCKPTVAHIAWDDRSVIRRVVRWAANVSRGQRDVRQTMTSATFVEGGTVGPVSKPP